MAARHKTISRLPDFTIWLLAALAVASLIGFGVYYYYDRYVHPNETVLERQANQIESLVKKDPQNPTLRASVAAYYLDAGLTDQAILQAQEGLKLDAKNQAALVILGNAYRQKGDTASAIKYYKQVVELGKDNSSAFLDPRLEAVYYELGKIYDEQGKFKEAIQSLESALAIDRTDADALYTLGKVYQDQNDHKNAIKQFEQALRFDPTYDQPYRKMVVSYNALGKKPEAAWAQGMISFTEGKYGDAAAQLEAVLRETPGLSQAYLGLGLAYEKMGKFEQAQTALHKYVEAKPDEFAGVDALGRVIKEVKQ